MVSPDHSQFQFAAERYVLGELSEQETLAFENHFFECAGCSQDVEDLIHIRDAAPAILPQLRALRPEKQVKSTWGWIPHFALGAVAVLAVISGYQNAVQIPRLKSAAAESGLQILPAPRTLTASRAAQAITLSTKDAAVPLMIPNEWPENYSRYYARVQKRNGRELMKAQTQSAQGSLLVSLPARTLGLGEFELIISGYSDGETPKVVARYPFTVQEKSTE
jgi:hypothetical protein